MGQTLIFTYYPDWKLPSIYLFPGCINTFDLIYNCFLVFVWVFSGLNLKCFSWFLVAPPPPLLSCFNWSLFLPVKFQYMSREVFQQIYLKSLSCLHDLSRRKILNQEWESSIFWGSLPLLPDLWPFSSWPVVATANASKHPQPTFKLGEQLIDQKICRHNCDI